MRGGAALLLALLAGGCARHRPPPRPRPTPTATPSPRPPAGVPAAHQATGSPDLPTPELDGALPARGSWRFQVSAAGPQAVFGTDAAGAVFSIRCDRAAGAIVFARPAAQAAPMEVVLRAGAATFATVPAPAGRIEARDAATDTFLTQVLAKADGPIGVVVGGGPAFVMPPDPAIGQVVARCAKPSG